MHRHFVIDHIDILRESIYDSSNRGGVEKRHRASEDALQEAVVEAARGVNLSMDSDDESHVDENTYNNLFVVVKTTGLKTKLKLLYDNAFRARWCVSKDRLQNNKNLNLVKQSFY